MQLGLEPLAEGFAVDTSSFMAINENYRATERETVWQRVTELIAEGRIKTTRLVMEELKRNDPDTYGRLNPHRRQIVVPDAELAQAAGRIARQFPRMARPLSPREKADQWVVTLGEVKGLTVVAQEGDAPGKIRGRLQSPGGPLHPAGPDAGTHGRVRMSANRALISRSSSGSGVLLQCPTRCRDNPPIL